MTNDDLMNERLMDDETPGEFPGALLAELYVGGDVSEETCAAFEAAIDDPDLLEQLAVAVQMRDAMAAASCGVSSSVATRQLQKRRLQWSAGLALATALGLAIAVWPTGGEPERNGVDIAQSGPSSVEGPMQQAGSAEGLAPVWVDLVDDPADRNTGFEVSRFESHDGANVLIEDASSEADLAFSDVDLSNVPDWMYAAVALPSDPDGLLNGVDGGGIENGAEQRNEETL